jgi:hypothetical protein
LPSADSLLEFDEIDQFISHKTSARAIEEGVPDGIQLVDGMLAS